MKYFGKVGFLTTEETDTVNHPGVYNETWVEKEYYGEHLNVFTSRWKQANNKLNDDINITTRISILADPFACNNFSKIRYVEWLNNLWEVSSVEVQYPRLILSIGDIYVK